MSQVLFELPPNYKQITAAIPAVAKNKAIIFVYAPYIYSPAGIELRPDLIAHEEVHVTRQGDDPAGWWAKYLVDKDFRLREELAAYQVQYRYMEQHYDRAKRRAILSSIAKDLSGPMYGGIITKQQAIKLIKNGVTA
jgi:hypothetical protein